MLYVTTFSAIAITLIMAIYTVRIFQVESSTSTYRPGVVPGCR